MKAALLSSWKTTVGGVIAGAVMILQQAQAGLDSDAATVIDWNIVAAAVGIIWMAIAARDNDVSSEKAGAR